MDPLVSLLSAIGVSLFVSSAIVIAMARPLRHALSQMCPTGDATSFWVAFTAVMLYVTPLLFAVFFPPALETRSIVYTLRSALAASLFGAFAGLLVIGYQVANARPRPR